MMICERHTTLRKRVEIRHHVLRHVIGPKAVEDEKQVPVRRVWLHADHHGKRQNKRVRAARRIIFSLRREYGITGTSLTGEREELYACDTLPTHVPRIHIRLCCRSPKRHP